MKRDDIVKGQVYTDGDGGFIRVDRFIAIWACVAGFRTHAGVLIPDVSTNRFKADHRGNWMRGEVARWAEREATDEEMAAVMAAEAGA